MYSAHLSDKEVSERGDVQRRTVSELLTFRVDELVDETDEFPLLLFLVCFAQ